VGVITLGDALGFIDGGKQPTKLAAMEGLWQTEKAPASFNAIAFPSQEEQRNLFSIKIPYLLSILVTHNLSTPIIGIKELEQQAAQRIKEGIPALSALEAIQKNPDNQQALATFDAHKKDLGYAFLLKRYAPDVAKATPAQIQKAARDTIPEVWILFWTFRLMVVAGFAMLIFLVFATLYSLQTDCRRTGFLKIAPWFIPLPFFACEMGWVTAEMGRQPWTVYEQLPTWISASTHSASYMIFSLTGFILLYSSFIVVEMYLMTKFVRKGPDQPASHGGGSLAGQSVFAQPLLAPHRD
jgi:cytochrome d ubiquinol oxidase subunit I